MPQRHPDGKKVLQRLSQETGGRFRYAGLLPRAGLPVVLDGAAVGLIPDVASRARFR